MIFRVVGAQRGKLYSRRCRACSEQLEQVVGCGHQRPFPIHLVQAPQSEAIQASGSFDLPKHWFHHGVAQGIDRLASLGSELPLHPPSGIKALGRSVP